MKKLKVSYILGILNAERTIKECLDSIFIQKTDIPYELVIVDGGSTDSTLKIINSFICKHKNIKIFHNPHKLSEGKGMSKDIGTQKANGNILIFLDHDNILMSDNWLENIFYPFKNKEIMASQSQLGFRKGDTNFIKYVNALGVEDPFATPVSLVSQVSLHPNKFKIVDSKYYYFRLNKKNILFGGANGCAFRKSVFKKIGGYTRDVDIFASMADFEMAVAVPIEGRVHHKTTNNLFSFLKKKGLYFYRFINKEYQTKKFRWIPNDFNGKLRFILTIIHNLTLIGPTITAIIQIIRTRKLFWILHPLYIFFITLEYGLISLFKIKNLINYVS